MRATEPSASPAEARLDDLVAAAERVQISEEKKRETLAAVLGRTQERPSRFAWVLRPAFVVAVLLLAGVSAAAALSTRWLAPAPVNVQPRPAIEPAPAPRPRPAATTQAPATETTMPAEVPEPAKPSSQPVPPRASAKGENPAQVAAALKALRQDHKPQQADELLNGYLKAYPHGALAEEARALLIESAVAQQSPRADRLASDYLRLYPHGRFRHAAQNVLDRAR